MQWIHVPFRKVKNLHLCVIRCNRAWSPHLLSIFVMFGGHLSYNVRRNVEWRSMDVLTEAFLCSAGKVISLFLAYNLWNPSPWIFRCSALPPALHVLLVSVRMPLRALIVKFSVYFYPQAFRTHLRCCRQSQLSWARSLLFPDVLSYWGSSRRRLRISRRPSFQGEYFVLVEVTCITTSETRRRR